MALTLTAQRVAHALDYQVKVYRDDADNSTVQAFIQIDTNGNPVSGGGGGADPVGLKNTSATPINPATEDKQDGIISAIGTLDSNQQTDALTDAELRASAVPVSGTVSAAQSGTWNINNVSGTVSLPTGAATQATLAAINTKIPASPAAEHTTAVSPNASRLSDGTSFYNALTDTQLRATPVPVTTAPTLTDHAMPAQGSLAGTALTGSYANIVTSTNANGGRILQIFNSCNQPITISLDGGTTNHYVLEVGDAGVTIDLAANGLRQGNNAIQAKHNGVVPTAGTIRCTVVK